MPTITYAMTEQQAQNLRVRVRALHRIRSHINDLCIRLMRTEDHRAVYGSMRQRANALPHTASDDAALSMLVTQWRSEIERLTPRPDDRSPHAVYARRVLPGILADLDTAGHPAPLDALLDEICRRAETVYTVYGRADPAAGPELALTVGWICEHPGRLPDGWYAVDGATCRESWDPGVEIPIELQVYLDGFGPESYAVLPYLLTHEIVCHAWARHKPTRSGLVKPSPFVEGMMDWVAWFFLRQWMPDLDVTFEGPALKHSGRLRDCLSARGPEGATRLEGIAAAERLHSWLAADRQLSGGSFGAEVMVARLALELNLAPWPVAAKDHLVNQLWPDMPEALEEELRSWAVGTSTAEDLLCTAIALAPAHV